MKRHVFPVGIVAVAAACVATLGACTGDPGPIATETPWPDGSDSPPTSPSPSSSASLAPLTDAELLALMPPDAAYPDIRGAIATARYFLDLYPQFIETGDARAWDAVSVAECIFCASVRDSVSELRALGEFRTGGALTTDPETIVANYYDVDGYWYVTFDYSEDAEVLHRADGTTEEYSPGEAGTIAFRMNLVDGGWRVFGVEAVAD